jgi:hypothetical protein
MCGLNFAGGGGRWRRRRRGSRDGAQPGDRERERETRGPRPAIKLLTSISLRATDIMCAVKKDHSAY